MSCRTKAFYHSEEMAPHSSEMPGHFYGGYYKINIIAVGVARRDKSHLSRRPSRSKSDAASRSIRMHISGRSKWRERERGRRDCSLRGRRAAHQRQK